MTGDLQDVFDRVGLDAPPAGYDADTVIARARRVRARQRWATAVGAGLAGVLAMALVSGIDHRTTGQEPTTGTSAPSISHRLPGPLREILVAGAGGAQGFSDGVGADARFTSINAIAVGPDGTVYVSDYSHALARWRVCTISASGLVTTIAEGSRTDGDVGHLAVDTSGLVYVSVGQEIRTIDPAHGNRMATLAGSDSEPPGTVDGVGAGARFGAISGLSAAPAGGLYVAEVDGILRQVSRSGAVTTLGQRTGRGTLLPDSFAVGSGGELYVAFEVDESIDALRPDGTVLASPFARFPSSTRPTMRLAFDRSDDALLVLERGHLFAVDRNGTVRERRVTGSDAPLWGIAAGPNGFIYAVGAGSSVLLLARED